MTLFSFPRMDGQPSRMSTEQLCEEAQKRGFAEGQAYGRLERENELKAQLAEQLKASQENLQQTLTEQLTTQFQTRYQNELNEVVSALKQSETERTSDLSDALVSIISTVCSNILEKELSTSSRQSIASIENLLADLPFAEPIEEIQVGQNVYQAWAGSAVKEIQSIPLTLNSSLAPTEIRLVSESHFHEISYQARLDSILSQIQGVFVEHE